jgi:hypothetical protein
LGRVQCHAFLSLAIADIPLLGPRLTMVFSV